MGAIGGAVGGVLHKAVQAGKIAKRTAWMIGAAYDVGAGTAWDMVAYGRTPSESFARNLFSFAAGRQQEWWQVKLLNQYEKFAGSIPIMILQN